MNATKAFMSYSWSSPEHEEWVLDLATSLRESGVDVILDKWDLKEGQEANVFMERMVSDKEIQKVIIVCDRTYAEKSNSREGGAGTEAQIISKELYQKEDQGKFVAVVREKDERGHVYIPAYYTSRIYIDFSDSAKFSESFERLLRWIEDKPILKKPDLGKLPAYLDDERGILSLSTNASKRRAYDAITGTKEHAYPATKEYFELFTDELEKFRLSVDVDPLQDNFLSNFEAFIPYRNECLDIVRVIARYTKDERYGDLIHDFFERLLQLYEAPEWMMSNRDIAFDNFKFFGHELLLHCGTIFIAEERDDLFNALLERQYYLERRARFGAQPLVEFIEFRQYLKSLEFRNEKLGLRRLSIAADMLKERTANSDLKFRKIMETDFILFLRAELANFGPYNRWWPETLVYLGPDYRALEIFDRSRSRRNFEKIRPFLGGATKTDLEQLIAGYQGNSNSLPRWGFIYVDPGLLMGLGNLCSRP